ncbi:possible transporter, RarD family, DMT superfamily [Rhodobacteraceae bacterium KLH11]|nr:possible transporter, RarD family, DMT superfamily [Rhodobacteraceae bacterium KLH11]
MADSTQTNRTRRPILAIVASVAALSLGDAVVKATSLSLPLWQMYILRSALALPLLWWLARRQGSVTLHAPLWIVVRSTLLVFMWLSYYASLPLMPLSLAAAAYYTGPLFIVALSAAVARRWPTGRALLAITCGFIGVLMIIRPENSNFEIATLLPILAAFLYACAMVLTSAKCSEDSPFVLALALNVAFIVTGVVFGLFSGREGSLVFGPWQPLDLTLFGTIAVLAVLILIGSVGAAYAYQKGQPTTVAAFDYCYLVFSLLWGSLFFNELPGIIALIGICVIVGAGILALPPSRGGTHRKTADRS